jgi:hypothetical protein
MSAYLESYLFIASYPTPPSPFHLHLESLRWRSQLQGKVGEYIAVQLILSLDVLLQCALHRQ